MTALGMFARPFLRPHDTSKTLPGSASGSGRASDRYRSRVFLAMAVFVLVYGAICGRLITLGLGDPRQTVSHAQLIEDVTKARPDIIDRNGTLLASDILVPSLYAEPHKILDVDLAVEDLLTVLPDLDADELRRRLSSGRRFAWVQRELSSRERAHVHALGIPGLHFINETRRVYPAGGLAAHVLGHVDIDNRGIAGIERYIDATGLADLHAFGFARGEDLPERRLTIDLRVQHALRDELATAMETFSAKAAGGVIIDARTGEVVALVSLPDYDPALPEGSLDPEAINRITTGVYELGSAIKAFTVAMALDAGVATLETRYDARSPIRIASFTIDDFHAQRRILTVPEVFVHSSNIGTARMALDVGIEGHQSFLERLGFKDSLPTELPESSSPLFPSNWGELSSMTISFGHGFSISPMQAVAAGAALVNGGRLLQPTFLERSEDEARSLSTQVLKPETSDMMRYLMRLNAEEGTARRADLGGFRIGGKTGTAEKVVDGRYSNDKILATFLAAFPMEDPRYVMLTMLDEPKGIPETHGYRTSGWNIVPATGRVIERIAPLLGVSRGETSDVSGLVRAEL
ncbi:MAG: penicillin-binding protein 2 [Pseudomonadota bacterium]